MTGKQFAAIRAKLGLTQAELADRLRYKYPYQISHFETGDRPVPHHVALLMIAYRDGYTPRANPKKD